MERLRDAQRKLERDREAVRQQLDKMEELRKAEVSSDTLKIRAGRIGRKAVRSSVLT